MRCRRLLSATVCLVMLLGGSARGDFESYGFFGTGGVQAPDPNVVLLRFPDGLTLPDPIIFEDFEGGAEFQLQSVGWSGENFTDPIAGHAGLNPDDPLSDSYLGWVLLTRTRLESVFGGLRLQVAPGQQFNGDPVVQLLTGNLLYAESDKRSGNQVQFLSSPVYDFTGRRDLVLAFNSAYEQNQDSFGGIEFTTDRGITWHPVVYLMDRDDIVRLPDGTVDAVATLTAPHGDVAVYTDPVGGGSVGGFYGAFVSAIVSPALAPFIDGRVNDDPVESKRLEA